MSNMSEYERAYALALVRNPDLAADQWEAIAVAAVIAANAGRSAK